MEFIRGFIYPVLILSSLGYSATLTLQVEREAGQFSGKRARSASKQELLEEHLPRQIEALRVLQRTFQATIDAQKERDPLSAFKAACSLANLQTLIASTQDVLSCLRAGEQSRVSIAIGAAPAVKQGIDQLIGSLDAAGIDCSPLKGLSLSFQEITRDIPNPDLPAE